MDPDAALQAVREAVTDWKRAAEGESGDREHHAALMLVEAWEGLDSWLSWGGFKPRAWS